MKHMSFDLALTTVCGTGAMSMKATSVAGVCSSAT